MSKPLNRNFVRIIHQSTEMFNESGVIGVSIQNIAQALSISPGNITYHFKKKTDIIHAIIDRLEDELLALLDTGVHLKKEVNPIEHYQLIEAIGGVLWRYRFVFNNILYLQSQDMKFVERFKNCQSNVIDTMVNLVEQSVENGWIQPSRAPKNNRLLSENMWFIWLSSLRLSQLEPSDQVGNAERNCILATFTHHMAYMENYYDEEMFRDLERYIQNMEVNTGRE